MERKNLLENIENIFDFILKYKNSFEKRKYFLINENYEIENREPSFIIELSYYFFQEGVKNKIEEIIFEEFKGTYIEKNKRIERKSKIAIEKLIDSFKRSLINQESIHSVKLGNELLYRDKFEFFKILYNISLISRDINKLIKVFFIEKIINFIFDTNNNVFKENREIVDEIIKNIINYFTKSRNDYLDFKNEKNIEYFVNNEVDLLYVKIYREYFDDIYNKYDIKGIKKLIFKEKIEYEYEKMSESKKILYNSLKKRRGE